jgi:hypothetical protein
MQVYGRLHLRERIAAQQIVHQSRFRRQQDLIAPFRSPAPRFENIAITQIVNNPSIRQFVTHKIIIAHRHRIIRLVDIVSLARDAKRGRVAQGIENDLDPAGMGTFHDFRSMDRQRCRPRDLIPVYARAQHQDLILGLDASRDQLWKNILA